MILLPKSWLKKRGFEDRRINHIANITLVDEVDNKREIRAKSPGTYIREFRTQNEQLDRALATHLIGKPESFGIMDDDYDVFFRKRCRRLSRELTKRILPSEADQVLIATPASETRDGLEYDQDSDSQLMD